MTPSGRAEGKQENTFEINHPRLCGSLPRRRAATDAK
jgi:hypothetical protein